MSFVGFAAFEAPSPDKQVVTRKGFAGKDRELERACKQCGKKDASTKLKGLDALIKRISDVDATEVRAVAHWLRDARVVELLGFKDDDARVRQGLYDALQACAAAGAPLRSVEAALAGPWWAATADACVAASPFCATAWRLRDPVVGSMTWGWPRSFIRRHRLDGVPVPPSRRRRRENAVARRKHRVHGVEAATHARTHARTNETNAQRAGTPTSRARP